MSEGSERILVVDDDPHNVDLMTELCRSLGYQVDIATDGLEALDRVKESRPDLVLLDLGMPRMDGFEVLERLKADDATAEIAVIIVTASADIDSKVRGVDLGADDYLTKPFKLFELKARIQAVLQVARVQDRLRQAEHALAQNVALDPLTGAGVFAQLHANLEYEVTRARRYGRPLAALFLAVDEFPEVRAALGAGDADALLKRLVEELRSVVRTVDRIFRLDVEEFLVLLPETDIGGGVAAAERVHHRVGELAQTIEGVSVTASIGVAAFPDPGVRSGEDLLTASNEAMKTARQAGRGLVGRHG